VATPRRRTGSSVKRRLLEQPHRFDFFQAMRLLEKIARQEAGEQGEARSVGYDGPPDREAVRLRVLCSRNFPAGEVYSIVDRKRDSGKQTGPRDARFAMVVSFMGLFGPNGVLPLHYTQTILDRVRRKDYALRDFIDLFHHRLISMFYRAWEKYRFPIALERAQAERGKNFRRDAFTQSLYSLIGLGTKGLESRLRQNELSELLRRQKAVQKALNGKTEGAPVEGERSVDGGRDTGSPDEAAPPETGPARTPDTWNSWAMR
jgi:type VI secretion system protein ImpH